MHARRLMRIRSRMADCQLITLDYSGLRRALVGLTETADTIDWNTQTLNGTQRSQ